MNYQEFNTGDDVPRTDGSLLRRLRSGEQDAATSLYHRYAKRIESLAKARTSPALAPRLDAEDVVQSVFRTFFRRVTEGQYQAPDGSELWNLFHVISMNKIRLQASHHRAAKRDIAATTQLEETRHGGSEQHLEEGTLILRMVIEDALDSLPRDQRLMTEMRIRGHSVAEIAAATKRSKRSVERLLQQFRTRLSRMLLEEPSRT